MATSSDDSEGTHTVTSGSTKGQETARRPRRTTLFPASTFEDALELATAIFKMGSGQAVRRITLLDELGKSPSSGTTRQQITNSSRYGLTTGGYNAEMLGVTTEGLKVVGDGVKSPDRIRARFTLAIEHVDVFKRLYESYLDNRLPAQAVLIDKAKELGVPEADALACVETFTVNAKFVGVLRSISGAERFISLDTLIADFSPSDGAITVEPIARNSTANTSDLTSLEAGNDFTNVCFYITPIGEEGSEPRRHADLFMGSLVEPALAEFGLQVVRAD